MKIGKARLFATTLMVVAAVACGEGKGAAAGEAGQAAGDTPGEGIARPPMDRAWVVFGGDTVVAEVARSPEEREQGLMYRESVPEGTGMLFVFPDQAMRGFWMKDTLVPLDIAYIDSALRVIDIQHMKAQDEHTYQSKGPAMYALEVPSGWFAAHGVKVGDVAQVVFGLGTGG